MDRAGINEPEGLRQLEHRHSWLWFLTIALLVCLGASVVTLYLVGGSSDPNDLLPAEETRGTLAIGLLGLTIIFSLYVLHQQNHLRRLGRDLMAARFAEESLRARLAGVASLFAEVAEVGELNLEATLQTLAEHLVLALRADRATFHLAADGSDGTQDRTPADSPEDPARDPSRQATLNAPLMVGEHVIGTLEVVRFDDPTGFTAEDRRIVTAFASNIAVTIRNVRNRQCEEQAHRNAKLEAVGRLAGGVAHDFNNLLTAIRGHGELILRRLGPDEPARRNAEEVLRATERAARVTRQLLSLTRWQVRRPTVLELGAVVGEMEGMLRQLTGERITLITRSAPKPWSIRADSGQLEQLILNLALNARDAMPTGGHITIETAHVEYPSPNGSDGLAPGQYVTLRVTDDGCGMDEATKARLFEPFFTTKQVGQGTGLGLATVYSIVRQNEGQIRVESAPGRGTTFLIHLPRDLTASVRPATDEPGSRSTGDWETILLVDDDDSVRQIANEVLVNSGFRVLEARSGSEAISLSEGHQGPIHLVLTDVVMPGMSGCEMASRVRTSRPEVSVLYMSGYTGDVLKRNGDTATPDAIIEKPFTADGLTVRVRQSLKARSEGMAVR